MKVKASVPFDEHLNSHLLSKGDYRILFGERLVGHFACAYLHAHTHMPTSIHRKSVAFLMVHINSIVLYVFHFNVIFRSTHPEIVLCHALRPPSSFSICTQYRYNIVYWIITLFTNTKWVSFSQTLSDS